MGTGCQKDDIEIADGSIEISSSPGISIYKTRGNYFNNVSIKIDSTNHVTMDFGYTKNDSRISISNDGKTTFTNRWYLKSGFIVAKEIYIDQSFTNISIGEYVNYTSKYNSGAWTDELLLARIIDRDPFLSFYHFDGVYQMEMKFTLGELNQMIENGTIEDYFTKLK